MIMKYAAGAFVAEAKLADGEVTVVGCGNLACTARSGQEAGPTDTRTIH